MRSPLDRSSPPTHAPLPAARGPFRAARKPLLAHFPDHCANYGALNVSQHSKIWAHATAHCRCVAQRHQRDCSATDSNSPRDDPSPVTLTESPLIAAAAFTGACSTSAVTHIVPARNADQDETKAVSVCPRRRNAKTSPRLFRNPCPSRRGNSRRCGSSIRIFSIPSPCE